MKKILLFAAVVAALVACKKDEPKQVHAVTFHVPGLAVETEPMNGPRKATTPPLTDEEGNQMTDLIIWDGTTYLTRQQNTDPNFGTVTVMLTTGEHHLHFIATRSTGLLVEDGILTCTSLKNTFGKTVHLNVAGGGDQNVTLDRLTGKLILTINDEIPTGASNLRIQIGRRYTSLDPQTLFGVNSAAFDQNVSLTSKVGQSGYQITLYMLADDADGYETTFTLTATNTSSQVIGQATGNITIAPNTKTLLSGNLFTGTRSFISLNSAWNADIEENF